MASCAKYSDFWSGDDRRARLTDKILKTIAVFDGHALNKPAFALAGKFRGVILNRIDTNTLCKKLSVLRIRPLDIERFIPHLGLGLWRWAKRFAFFTW
jgi:hypothetical protein